MPAPRPAPEEYLMGIALAVRARANCTGQKVGAIIALDRRVVSTGYNGTPQDRPSCLAGGCVRCANRGARLAAGTLYDLCICVHAEQNALLSAARFGIGVAGGDLYTTTRPCFGCTKELLQAGIRAVYFIHDWAHPDADFRAQYERIQARFQGGIRRLAMVDPQAEWATPRSTPPDTGHRIVD